MIWSAVMWTARKGSYRLEVWQGYDGEWRASVHYKGQMNGKEGKRTWKTFPKAQKYAIKLLKMYRKDRTVP